MDRLSGDSVYFNWKKIYGVDLISLKSLQLSADGSHGWGIDKVNKIARFRNGEILAYHNTGLGSQSFNALWISKDGDNGFAVGDKGTIFRLSDGQWVKDNILGYQLKVALKSVAMSENMNSGYIVGEKGTLLSYSNFQWGFYQPKVANEKINLSFVMVSPDGQNGFMMDDQSEHQFFLKRGQWTEDTKFVASQEYLSSFNFNNDFSKGWALGLKGGVYYYSTQQGWLRKHSDNYLSKLIMNPDLTEGWAVGSGGNISHFKNNEWTDVHGATYTDLNDVWINKSFSKGWTVGLDGVVLFLNRNKWDIFENGGKVNSSKILYDCWINKAFDEGWAVGSNGRFFRYKNGRWKFDEASSAISKNWLYRVSMNSNGTEGWAIGGYGRILHFINSHWIDDSSHYEYVQKHLYGLWLSKDFGSGFIVGENGTILSLGADHIWHVTRQPIENADDLEDVWSSQDQSQVWIVGENGKVYNYSRKTLTVSDSSSDRTEGVLNRIAVTEDGKSGYVSGDDATMLYLSRDNWKLDPGPSNLTNRNLEGLALSKDNNKGWIVGESGRTIYLQRPTWYRVETDSITSSDLHGIAMNENLSHGFAVGDGETILEFRSSPLGIPSLTYEFEQQLEKLEGKFTIHFPRNLQTPPIVSLMDDQNVSRLGNSMIKTSFADDDSSTVILSFNNTTQKVQELSRKLCSFQIDCHYKNKLIKQNSVYKTGSFYLTGTPYWVIVTLCVIGIVIVNAALILLAIPFRFFRRLLFHPVGSAVVGLVVGKYLFTDFVVRFVSPVKLSLFKSYREKLKEAPFLDDLRGRHYIQQDLVIEDGPQMDYKECLRKMFEYPTNSLWIIIGESGLGKTLLTKQWTDECLAVGKTPILIRLGSEVSASVETKALFYQFGDIDMSEESVLDLVKAGGYQIFLDGYNEDNMRSKTKEFIRNTIKNNLVVLTSQNDPGWTDNTIKLKPITLKPFTLDQLKELIPEKWLATIFKEEYLKQFAILPKTAGLLANYINGNDQLPDFKLDVYLYLIRDVSANIQINKLDIKAWEMFTSFSTLLVNKDDFDENFIKKLIDSGVITPVGKNYGFTHELIQKFFVGRYLFKRNLLDLEMFHTQYFEGNEKTYWEDPIELCGELIASSGQQDKQKRYYSFLKTSLQFSTPIFKRKLYPQMQKLQQSGVISENQEFKDWMADYLVTQKD